MDAPRLPRTKRFRIPHEPTLACEHWRRPGDPRIARPWVTNARWKHEHLVYTVDYDRLLLLDVEEAWHRVALDWALDHAATWGELARLVHRREYRVIADLCTSRFFYEGGLTADTLFEPSHIPGRGEGAYPFFPTTQDHEWLPPRVRDLGEDACSSSYLGFELPAEREDQVLQAFASYGVRCEPDDELLARALASY